MVTLSTPKATREFWFLLSHKMWKHWSPNANHKGSLSDRVSIRDVPYWNRINNQSTNLPTVIRSSLSILRRKRSLLTRLKSTPLRLLRLVIWAVLHITRIRAPVWLSLSRRVFASRFYQMALFSSQSFEISLSARSKVSPTAKMFKRPCALSQETALWSGISMMTTRWFIWEMARSRGRTTVEASGRQLAHRA